jgi:hypothetical protein
MALLPFLRDVVVVVVIHLVVVTLIESIECDGVVYLHSLAREEARNARNARNATSQIGRKNLKFASLADNKLSMIGNFIFHDVMGGLGNLIFFFLHLN